MAGGSPEGLPPFFYGKHMRITLFLVLGLVIAGIAEGVVKGDQTRHFQVAPGQEIPVCIPLGNDSDTPMRITLKQCDYLYDASGINHFDPIGSHPRSNGKWITLHTDQVVLNPESNTDLFYKIRVPNDPALQGSYWSLILIEPDQVFHPTTQQQGMHLQIKVRYAYLVITTFKGGKGDLQINNLTQNVSNAEKRAFFDVTNTGTLFLEPKLTLQLYDGQGKLYKTKKVTAEKILPTTSTKYNVDLSDVNQGTYSGLLLLESGDEHLFGERVQLTLQ